MHEQSLMADMMRKIFSIVEAENATAVSSVTVRLGALAHISPDHFREHFEQAAQGTCAEGARVDVIELEDRQDPQAQDIVLDSIELVD
ncbi:MAG: hydrogenase maturation nickel metallochaperone HypA [Nitrospina sp.]|nr:hydrogenase maturation nickel metallochaperone HypA [Nitrospina sp.]